MKIFEILTEMRRGKVGANVTTVDMSAPWVQRNAKKTADRTKGFDQLPTTKEKLDFLSKETNGFTKLQDTIRVKVFMDKRSNMDPVLDNWMYVKSYDPATGDIVLRGAFQGKNIKLFKTNASQLEFVKRDRSIQKEIAYLFRPNSDLFRGEWDTEENPNYVSPPARVPKTKTKTKPNDGKKALSAFDTMIRFRKDNPDNTAT
jgi:hypothetical protein